MPKKTRLLDIPASELPKDYPFYYGRVPARLMQKVEKKRDTEGHTVKFMLEKMCELYLKGE